MSNKRLKKICLFPHFSILLLTTLLISAWLIYLLQNYPTSAIISIITFAFAFYLLLIWCIHLIQFIRWFKWKKNQNLIFQLWKNNPKLRINFSLVTNLVWDGIYALFQFCLGIKHQSLWYYFLSAYYSFLAIMRFFLAHHSLHHDPGEKPQQEIHYYRFCGWIFLLLNLALSGMIFIMIQEVPTIKHHSITTIAMAVYTFTNLIIAIKKSIQYHQLNSPIFSATSLISLTTALVAMLTLENNMLSVFANDTMTIKKRKLFLILSGGTLSICINIMAISMIIQSNRKLYQWRKNNERQ